ncbi:MAG: EAL domain-containing response regulator [Nitrosomonas sp.]|nr:MAG: EAL domain-containing response regulator [Nitrosomonas sp.]
MFKSEDLPTELKSAQIMLIDDDDFVLDYLESLLSGLGMKYLFRAGNGQQALDLIDSKQCSPQLMFCDLAMPGMDGIEFFRHLAKRRYQGGVVIVSGVDRQLVVTQQRLLQEHGLKFLGIIHKPFDESMLVSILLKSAVISLFTDSTTTVRKLSVEEIGAGLVADCIETYFQPKVSLDDSRVVGAECLVRWNHPQLGILPPSAFIPVAEEHGLIGALTVFIFRKAVNHLRDWEQRGHSLTMSVSINLSMETIAQFDLPDLLASIVEQSGLDASRIIFELTESGLLDDLTVELEVVSRIRLKGFGISIDDFGIGYSSVEKLKLLPLTELKIDRSFVHGACEDSVARIIFESCTRMGKALNIDIVAEGVETLADIEMVKAAGCNIVQGYYFAPPMPAEEFVAWKTKWDENLTA